MFGASKADNVFGQVVICLRMSKLDYMIKATPYSAYVTIRKKFVKSAHEEVVEEQTVKKEWMILRTEKIWKKKIGFLKKRLKK